MNPENIRALKFLKFLIYAIMLSSEILSVYNILYVV